MEQVKESHSNEWCAGALHIAGRKIGFHESLASISGKGKVAIFGYALKHGVLFPIDDSGLPKMFCVDIEGDQRMTVASIVAHAVASAVSVQGRRMELLPVLVGTFVNSGDESTAVAIVDLSSVIQGNVSGHLWLKEPDLSSMDCHEVSVARHAFQALPHGKTH